MSRLRQFHCDHCGYRARVFGGVSYGFEVVLTTIACATCERLYDALAEERLGDVAEGLRNGQRPELNGVRCPVDERHSVAPWKNGEACPKCGEPLAANGEGP